MVFLIDLKNGGFSMLIFGTIIIAFLLLFYPLLDIKYTKSLKEKKDSESRLAYYKFVIISEWLVVLVITAFIFLNPESDLKNIGITLSGNSTYLLSLLLGMLAGIGLFVFMQKKFPNSQKNIEKNIEYVDYLLPTNKVEVRWSIFVAITAGICEEIIYRGFVIYYLQSFPIELETIYLALISGVIFGIAHAYQGWKGMLSTGIIGILFAILYVQLGSLILLMILHTIIDLRSFLLTKPLAKD